MKKAPWDSPRKHMDVLTNKLRGAQARMGLGLQCTWIRFSLSSASRQSQSGDYKPCMIALVAGTPSQGKSFFGFSYWKVDYFLIEGLFPWSSIWDREGNQHGGCWGRDRENQVWVASFGSPTQAVPETDPIPGLSCCLNQYISFL